MAKLKRKLPTRKEGINYSGQCLRGLQRDLHYVERMSIISPAFLKCSILSNTGKQSLKFKETVPATFNGEKKANSINTIFQCQAYSRSFHPSSSSLRISPQSQTNRGLCLSYIFTLTHMLAWINSNFMNHL